MATDDRVQISNYAVAFIDVLGQRERLAAFDVVPDARDQEQCDRFISAVKDTVGAVARLHRDIETFFREYQQAVPRIAEPLPASARDFCERVRRTELTFQRFSDGLVIFASVADSNARCPINSIYGMLIACGAACLMALARKEPVRGGIELGWGTEWHKGELYGSAVSQAYALESEVAQFPRFAVGQGLLSYLDSFKRSPGSDIDEQYGRDLATACLELITTDQDGIAIVDYLGPGFREYVCGDLDAAVVKAFQFVREQLDYWAARRDTKMAGRYVMLREYFVRRWSLWFDRADSHPP